MDRSNGALLEQRDLVKEDAERFARFYVVTIVVLLLVSGIIEALPSFLLLPCLHRSFFTTG